MAGIAKRPDKGSKAPPKVGGGKGLSCAQRIEQATVHRTQVSMTELMVQDAEALFATHDSEGTALLSRGALTELLREVGLEATMGSAFGATARLAFDAHSADSHFLSLAEFKQLYYVVNQRYPSLLPRAPFLKINVLSASGLPPADVNGKSDPFTSIQIPGKPTSKSETKVVEKTLDPVWGRRGVGEEFHDKYAYEEGDCLEFIVMDYDKGETDYEVLGSGKLNSSDFHKPGGFSGEIQLSLPPDFGKEAGKYAPKLKIRVVVNELEKIQKCPVPVAPPTPEQPHNESAAARLKAAGTAAKLIAKRGSVMAPSDDHHGGQGEPAAAPEVVVAA